MKKYKDANILKDTYYKYGSLRKAAPFLNTSSGTVLNWLRKYHIPRLPQLHLYDNHSGWGRLNELFIAGHPFFIKNFKDFGEFDKSPFDGIWQTEKVNIKCTHSKRKLTIRIKNSRHVVKFYICSVYNDDLDPLIPIAIFVIPAHVVSHTSITLSLSLDSKFAKYLLKGGVDFDLQEGEEYNRNFKKKYQIPTKR